MAVERATSTELTRLWRHIFGDASGAVCIGYGDRLEPNDRALDGYKETFYPYPMSAAFAEGILRQQAARPRRETYFCAHLMKPGAKIRSKANAADVLALWADLDGASIPADFIRPTALVQSSPGRLQGYWRLSRPLPATEAESLNKRLTYFLDADPSGWDLTQLLRPPGFPNRKREAETTVEIIHIDDDRHCEPEDFDRLLPQAPTNGALGASVGAAAVWDGDEPPVRLSGDALAIWRGERPVLRDDGQVDRSKSLWKIGAVLYRANAVPTTIAAALAERDATLGYGKAAGRNDGGKWFAAMADSIGRKAVAEVIDEPTDEAPPTPIIATPVIGTSPPPTSRPKPPWPTLRDDAWHGLAGAILDRITPETEADPAALLVGVLVSFGSMAGRGPHAYADGARHGLNEFALVVGDSAKARKDTARMHVRRLAGLVDFRWADQCQGSGLSSGEGFIHAIRDRVAKMERNKRTGAYEEVEADPGIADKRLLVDESEFATILKVAQRDTNTLSDNIRKAWDGRDLRSMTRNSPLRASAPHVSVIANITREELQRTLTETEAANGFMNRFLIVCARRSQLLPHGGGFPDFSGLTDHLAAALEWSREERRFRRDADADALWTRAYYMLWRDTRGLVGSILARAEAHLLRLSCIYAALDLSEAVSIPHLRAAIAVWRYCEESVRYLFGDASGDYLADRIHEQLIIADAGGMTRSELSRACASNNVPAARFDAALGLLHRTRRATWRKEQPERGRPAEVWTALPSDLALDEWDAVLDGTYDTKKVSFVTPTHARARTRAPITNETDLMKEIERVEEREYEEGV